jgi:His/Glu/Gln/Arg/opine family amino acid ABC transporter permease subunit
MDGGLALLAEHAGEIWRGFLVTLLLAAAVLALGTALAVPVALARESGNRLLAWPALVYVNAFRALPALLILYFTFYALPQFGLRLSPLDAALAGLVLVGAAYLSEDIRGGLRAIPAGQWRAATALGLSYAWTVRRIILPQVARIAVGPYMTRAMLIVKSTSLAGVVAVNDLTGVTYGLISHTYQATDFLAVTAAIYLLLNTLLSVAQLAAERHFRAPGRPA